MEAKDLRLYAITDRHWLNGRTLAQVVEESLEGGVTFLQLREKGIDREEIIQEAKEIKELCHKYNVPFIINDDVEIALAVDADGVHVGQKDMEVGAARKKLGPDKIIGVSAKTVEQALEAEKNGANYLGVGAVFATGSKADATTIDHQVLKQISEAVSIPVVAIGGITYENMDVLKGKGVSGVAVISAVYAQEDIKKAAIELKKKAMEL